MDVLRRALSVYAYEHGGPSVVGVFGLVRMGAAGKFVSCRVFSAGKLVVI